MIRAFRLARGMAALCTLVFASSAWPQTNGFGLVRHVIFLPPPIVKIAANEQPITIKKMDISVEVEGLDSETTTTITFANPNDRVLEGELEFPLPDGASVTGYALDVGGKMIDGVIVEKEKARVVLETEIRRGVDPGLVEHVKGNIFRTRLYPIPARGERTVRITSSAQLTLFKEDAAMRIPLPVGQKIPSLALSVRVGHPPVKPEVGGFGNLTFTAWHDGWSAKTSLNDVTPENDLFVNLPKLPSQFNTVENAEGETFVSVSDAPKIPSLAKASPPTSITIAWDASGSRRPEAVKRDRALLVELFKMWPDVSGKLIVFRDHPEPAASFEVKRGNASKLLAMIDGLAYDGATDFSKLDLRAGAVDPVVLLFTDGLSTLGESLPKLGGARVNVYASDSTRDSGVQGFIARSTGGLMVDLTAGDAASSARALERFPVSLLRIESSVIDDVQSQFDVSANRSSVYARLKTDGDVTLIYGVNGKEIARSKINLKKAAAVTGHNVARGWASLRATELAVLPDRNAQALLELGRKYHLVTPGTSLLVLERVEQYVEHDIAPPESMPEWRTQYFAQLKGREKNAQQTESQKLESVLNLWKRRTDWWETKFPKSVAAEGGYGGGGIGSGVAGAGMAGGRGSDGQGFRNRSAAAPSERAKARGASMADAPPSADGSFAGLAAPPPESGGAAGAANGASAQAPGGVSVQIKEWNPNTPYLAALENKKGLTAYAAYLEQRKLNAGSPSFYLDCANFFFKQDRNLALRVLSNLAELKLEDAGLLRVYAWRLIEAGELDRAIELFDHVRTLRPEEPQSKRDLALALGLRLDRDKRKADGIRAIRLLYDVIVGPQSRFPEIEVIAAMELNQTLARLEKIDSSALKDAAFVDKRVRKLMDLDVRITMSWDADNTDMDLHVIEPSGEEAFYGHQQTQAGGLVSHDITVGYGPEEYVIRRALPGIYKIRAKYYGSRQQTLTGPVTVSAVVITNFGRANEARQRLTLRLTKTEDMVDVGSITFGKTGSDTAQVSKLTRETLKKLKRGMKPEEVIAIMGTPERKDGATLASYHFRLSDGTEIIVGFAPDLTSVKEVLDGAIRDLPL